MVDLVGQINWQKCGGLVPVVTQEAHTKEVLMQAFVDEEALKRSLESGFAHYFSRTKGSIWKKGETSGFTQKIVKILLDCDNDAVLYLVEQEGVACHSGQKSCFYREIKSNSNLTNSCEAGGVTAPKYDILDKLYHTAIERKFAADSQNSYIAKLYSRGENGYLKKICEEAGEFCCALKDAKSGDENRAEHGSLKGDVIYEASDLLFHLVIALADLDLHPSQILKELERREGTSGIAEKKSRENQI